MIPSCICCKLQPGPLNVVTPYGGTLHMCQDCYRSGCGDSTKLDAEDYLTEWTCLFRAQVYTFEKGYE